VEVDVRVCLDIDGVIANPYEEVNRRLKEEGYAVSDWETWANERLTETYHWIPNKLVRGMFKDKLVMKNAVPFDDSWYWVNHHSKDHEIICVTHRAGFLKTVTWNWFFDWNIDVNDIMFVQDKGAAIESIGGCDIYVDDFYKNVKNVEDAGYKSFLMSRNYNKYSGDDVDRINSLWELDV
jgi:uncharacterized HAD superfamily protein